MGIGPGNVSKCLGITLRDNDLVIKKGRIWIEENKNGFDLGPIFSGPRIGVDYAGEDALLPYRYWVNLP